MSKQKLKSVALPDYLNGEVYRYEGGYRHVGDDQGGYFVVGIRQA